jgi:hypothetical protein
MPIEVAMHMGYVFILVLATKHWWRWCSKMKWWQLAVLALVGG